ncbi:hypothetical protein [Mycolicibacterium gadium]|uniref:ESX-1 secretion-associated protein EspA/EspE-like domain-containing protein n=1 Tax=Mycolicibacterium gadium TaxID=1794 RepID=A0ABT6GNM0_MYCGU|nr:hypothetical protein [Mycolicibacterium gadium]MDG5483202.1 hypothetical protein [Mycolicibacterium gadium]
MALLVVIGVTAAVTISVTKNDGDGEPSPSGETFGLASADDKGPANIITEDPSCAAWGPISQTFVDLQKKGWGDRDPSIAEPNWTPAQRKQYEEVGRGARDIADQTVQLAKLTPHRVMRELFEQYIAYARAYADAIPNYEPSDNHIAGTMIALGSVLTYACSAITYGSALSRGPLISAPAPPSEFAALANPNEPSRFMPSADSTCGDWEELLTQYAEDLRPWEGIDSAIPASSWTADQRKTIDATIPVMNDYADRIEQLGRSSTNPIVQDLATFSSQYRRAYAAALPTYVGADGYLDSTAHRTMSIVYEACKAAGAA